MSRADTIRSFGRRLLVPETFTVMLLIGAFVICSNLSEHFLDIRYLLDSSSLYIELGIITLAMSLVIVSGEIDLSVASMLALVACWTTWLHAHWSLPYGVCMLMQPILGGLLGAFNGWVINRFGIPSLVVTLATLAFYRGLAQIAVGDRSLPIPAEYVGIDFAVIPGTAFPVPLALFLGFAVLFYVLLHRTVFGRRIFAIGSNREAALYAGVNIKRINQVVFTISGVVAGIGAMLMNSRLGIARYDHATGLELECITAVLIGGISIQGGRGTIFGSVVALAAMMVMKSGMGVANVSSEYQLAVIGLMLIISVVVARLLEIFGR